MVDWIVPVGLFIAGFLCGKLESVLTLIRETNHSKERRILFDKALTKGDGAALYNLRVADGVTQREEVVNNALATELSRHEPEEAVNEPWGNDPMYANCDITFDIPRNIVMVVDSENDEFWEEPLDKFMAKFETMETLNQISS